MKDSIQQSLAELKERRKTQRIRFRSNFKNRVVKIHCYFNNNKKSILIGLVVIIVLGSSISAISYHIAFQKGFIEGQRQKILVPVKTKSDVLLEFIFFLGLQYWIGYFIVTPNLTSSLTFPSFLSSLRYYLYYVRL